jgi:hypothetical protein
MRFISAVLTIALCCSSELATAQRAPTTWRSTAKNSVFIELFGNAGILSYNVDRKLNQNITARFAYGRFWSIDIGDQPGKFHQTYTGMINWLASGPIWWHELGIGATSGSYRPQCCMTPGSQRALAATWGFRRQPIDGGFVLRIGFTPAWVFEGDGFNDGYAEGVRLRAGVSAGFAF